MNESAEWSGYVQFVISSIFLFVLIIFYKKYNKILLK